MTTATLITLAQDCSARWLPAMLDASLKGLALLSAAALAVALMRRASAAARQLVWFWAIAATLLLPVFSAALPDWRILPAWAHVSFNRPAQTPAPKPANPASLAPSEVSPSSYERPMSAAPLPPAVPEPARIDSPAALPAHPAAAAPLAPEPAKALPQPSAMELALPWLLAAWAAGALLCLAPVALGWLSLWRLARRCRPVTDPAALDLLARAAATLGLNRRVLLLESRLRPMPMIWGLFHHKLLLPSEASSWPADRRWVVLLHELGHAKRWDCLTRLLAHLACAVYWFNPLAWLALLRLQNEAERACDDLVLAAGSRPSDYAEHVLHIASSLQSPALSVHGAIAMARPSRLEGRLLAILDPLRNRRALTRLGLLLASAALLAVAIPIAILRAGDKPVEPSGFAAQPTATTASNVFAAAVADRFTNALKRANYSWLDDNALKGIHADIQGLATQYQSPALTGEMQQAILNGIDGCIAARFPPVTDTVSREGAYCRFPDNIKTFQWALCMAIRQGPLDAAALSRRAAQRDWMRALIRALPEEPPYTHQRAVGTLETLFDNPLSVLFSSPMSDVQFERFQALCKENAAGDKLPHVVAHLVWRALQAQYPDPKSFQLPFSDDVNSWGAGTWVELGFKSDGYFKGRQLGMRSDSLLDVTGPVMRGASEAAQFRSRVDVAVDQSHGISLKALRGAKFVPMSASDWIEADRITSEKLQEMAKAKGTGDFPLARFKNLTMEALFADPSRFVGVCTADNRVAVLEVTAVDGDRSVTLHIRPRPAAPTATAPATQPVAPPIPALIGQLGSPEAKVREEAQKALVEIGPEAARPGDQEEKGKSYELRKARLDAKMAELVGKMAAAESRRDRAAIDSIRVEGAKVDLEGCRLDLQRLEGAVGRGTASTYEVGKARLRIKMAELAVRVAEAETKEDTDGADRIRQEAAKVGVQMAQVDLEGVADAVRRGTASAHELEAARLEVKVAELAVLRADAEARMDRQAVFRIQQEAADLLVRIKELRVKALEAGPGPAPSTPSGPATHPAALRIPALIGRLGTRPAAAREWNGRAGEQESGARATTRAGGASVGYLDLLSKADMALRQAGAKDISSRAGTAPPFPASKPNRVREFRWYELADGTCLQLDLERGKGEPDGMLKIEAVTLGQQGKGYQNRDAWLAQRKIDVVTVNLGSPFDIPPECINGPSWQERSVRDVLLAFVEAVRNNDTAGAARLCVGAVEGWASPQRPINHDPLAGESEAALEKAVAALRARLPAGDPWAWMQLNAFGAIHHWYVWTPVPGPAVGSGGRVPLLILKQTDSGWRILDLDTDPGQQVLGLDMGQRDPHYRIRTIDTLLTFGDAEHAARRGPVSALSDGVSVELVGVFPGGPDWRFVIRLAGPKDLAFQGVWCIEDPGSTEVRYIDDPGAVTGSVRETGLGWNTSWPKKVRIRYGIPTGRPTGRWSGFSPTRGGGGMGLPGHRGATLSPITQIDGKTAAIIAHSTGDSMFRATLIDQEGREYLPVRTIANYASLPETVMFYDGVEPGMIRSITVESRQVRWATFEDVALPSPTPAQATPSNSSSQPATVRPGSPQTQPAASRIPALIGQLGSPEATQCEEIPLGRGKEVVTRTYDVRDLLAAGVNFEAPAMGWSTGDEAPGAAAPAAGPEDAGKKLIEKIRKTVAPDSWKNPRATIVVMQGQLIITQAREVHDEVVKAVTRMRSVLGIDKQIMISCRIVTVPAGETNLWDFLIKEAKATFTQTPDGVQSATISPELARTFIAKTQAGKGYGVLSAPRLMLTNGQRNYFTVGSSVAVKLPVLEGAGEALMYFRSGAVLDVQAALLGISDVVEVQAAPVVTKLLDEVKPMQADYARANVTAQVPAGRWLVLRIPIQRRQLVGVRQEKDAATGQSQPQVVEKDIPGPAQPPVYVLLQPETVVRKEAKTRFPPPTLPPAGATSPAPSPDSAPSTHPAASRIPALIGTRALPAREENSRK